MKSHAVLSKQSPQLGKRHLEVMDELESMLDKGKSFSTMSDLAKQLKISLRTLYEIAPSKEELIVTTVDRVLKKHGKIAIDAMNAHSSPIKKLESLYARKLRPHARISKIANVLEQRMRVLKDKNPGNKNIGERHKLTKRYFEFLKQRTKQKTEEVRRELKFRL